MTEALQPARRPLWAALAFVHFFGFVALLLWVCGETRPVPMHGLQLAAGEKLRCVSYAPFHRPGQTPFDETLRISRQQIEEDLRALSALTACVRIYAANAGMEQVPAVARELGLKVLLGAWIGYDREKNAIELDRAIALANEYRDVVRALIVGNEVLLRRERTPDEMRALLASARAASAVPVTYADVWEFWLKHDELADAVDFVTVHILPFWEDEPVDIADALIHVADIRSRVGAHFSGKPVLVGETGWPGAGRQREASRPSRVNQARYVREFVYRAHAEGWDYNLIEAIDQPWKRALEGTVGGYWGILDANDLRPKFPLTGAVAERDGMALPLGGAAVGAALALALALIGRVRALCRAPWRLAAVCFAGATTGLVAVLHAEHAVLAYASFTDWATLGTVAFAAVFTGAALARWQGDALMPADEAWQRVRKAWFAAGDVLVSSACHEFVEGRSSWDQGQRLSQSERMRIGRRLPGAADVLSVLRGFLLFAAAVAALLLLVAPRYRDFASLLYLTPAMIYGVAGWWQGGPLSLPERICAVVIVVCAAGRYLPEPANPQAAGWLLTLLALALPVVGWGIVRRRKGGAVPRHGEQDASSGAAAAKP
ncbi:MAG: beta-1,6-glucan synthase [Azoarcus sp.]|jgi:glucan 1,3-beta-glucosidase|nr:beta-1,6-glucan synthase [Azoarcus sp.]